MSEVLRLGIFGWPVAHSKSPAMHESAARALGIGLVYEKFAVEPTSLSEAILAKHRDGIDGYNVTVPHKRAVVTLLDDLSAEASAIGAVNTVVKSGESYLGYNTDAPGFVRSLEETGLSLEGLRVSVLGAGGAARAGIVGLARAGAASIDVIARRPERAAALVDALRGRVDVALVARSLDEAHEPFSVSDLLVQATSATLGSNPLAAAFAEALPIDALPTHAAVVDMVYQPRHTTVLAKAASRGLRTIDGLGMLLHQGAIAFEMWTGATAPLDVMRNVLLD